MFLCIGMGFSFGAQILLSQQVGAKDHDLQPTIGTLFTTELIASVISAFWALYSVIRCCA